MPIGPASRMLLVDRTLRGIRLTGTFRELPGLSDRAMFLVHQQYEGFPARLFGRAETGCPVEIFLDKGPRRRRLGSAGAAGPRVFGGKKDRV